MVSMKLNEVSTTKNGRTRGDSYFGDSAPRSRSMTGDLEQGLGNAGDLKLGMATRDQKETTNAPLNAPREPLPAYSCTIGTAM